LQQEPFITTLYNDYNALLYHQAYVTKQTGYYIDRHHSLVIGIFEHTTVQSHIYIQALFYIPYKSQKIIPHLKHVAWELRCGANSLCTLWNISIHTVCSHSQPRQITMMIMCQW